MLVVSTDQAHSLGDVLGVAVPPTGGGEPVRILTEEETDDSGGGHLDALALDTLALLEARWRDVAPAAGRPVPGVRPGRPLRPRNFRRCPGIQEVLGLHEVAELAASGRWDHVVVDCASTADAMRMLTLPATFACTSSGPGRATAG